MADGMVELDIRPTSPQSTVTTLTEHEHARSLARPASTSQLSARSTSQPRTSSFPHLTHFSHPSSTSTHEIEESDDGRRSSFDPFVAATSPGGPLARPTASFPPSPRRPGPTIPPQTPPESVREGSIRTGPRSPTTSAGGGSVPSAIQQQHQVLSGIGAVAAIQRTQSTSAGQGQPRTSQHPPRADRIGTSSRSLSGPTLGGTVGYDSSSAPGVSAGANWVQQEQYRREEAYSTGARKANHLPPMGPGFSGLTSLPISDVQRDIEFSIKALLTPKLFVRLMDDPLARHRFREHCELFENGVQLFDSWLDLRSLATKLEATEMAASAIQDLYLTPSAPLSFAGLSEGEQEHLKEATTLAVQISPFLEGSQKKLQDELYHNQFMSFLKYKMIEGATWRLGKWNLDDDEVAGLGDCLCLTNPRLRDHPIVLCSSGFSKVTGYSARSIVGRNCRFLQGPATSPEAVDRVRQALNKGETATNLLINYRRDGTAFFNLLCIMPLRDSTGQISYFLGGQVNVTSFLSSDRGLSFLVGGSHQDLENLPPANSAAQSPALSAYLSTLSISSLNAKAYPLHTPKIRKAAGEASDAAYSSGRLPFVAPGKAANGVAVGAGGAKEGTMGKIAQVLGFKEKKSAAKKFEDGELYGKQKIVGAEGTLDKKGGGVETQIEAFQHTYTRALIFRSDPKHSIIFVTEPLLRYVGLPHKTPLELYSSKLLHKDLFDIIEGAERESTAQLKRSLKLAINATRAFSTPCGLKSSFKTNLLGAPIAEGVKYGTLHLTPLADSEGNCEAYCAIFG